MDLITTAAPENYIPPSTAIKHNITASLIAGELPDVVHITQYGQTLPIIAVRLMGNNVPYAVPAGAAVNFRARKPDGKYIYNPALGISADRSTAYIAVTPQTAATAGKMRAVIEIVLDGAIAATASFLVEIATNPVLQDAIDSQDEYLTIQDLLQAAREAAEAAKYSETAAADSAADAAKSASDAQTSATQATDSASSASDHAEAAKKSAQDASASETAAKSSETAASGSAKDAASSASAAADSEEAARKYAEMAQQIGQGAKGWYANEAALKEAHPTGKDGDWAIVGTTDTVWVWDSDTGVWRDSGQAMDLSNYYTKPQTDALLKQFLLASWPVGSLYWSLDATSPEELFGGTWIRITDTFIVAAGSKYPAGTSGGEPSIKLQHLHKTSSHTLTVNELPKDIGTIPPLIWGAAMPTGAFKVLSGSANVASLGEGTAFGQKTIILSGGGGAHDHGNTGNALSNEQSIIPPYEAYYCWRRTA